MSRIECTDSFNRCFFENVQRQIDARRALVLTVRPDMDAAEALLDWLLEDDFQRTHIDGQLPQHLRALRRRAQAGDVKARDLYERVKTARGLVERFQRLDPGQRREIESAMWYCEPLNQVTLA